MAMSLPLALTVLVMCDELYIRWDARRMGAVLVPRVSDPYPGGIKTLIQGIRSFKVHYPGRAKYMRGFHCMHALAECGGLGDGFHELCEKFGGYTFNRRILFGNRVWDD